MPANPAYLMALPTRIDPLLHIIGERPGSGHRTLSIYMTTADGATWGIEDKVDHNITKVVSGIATTAFAPELAAVEAVRILRQM